MFNKLKYLISWNFIGLVFSILGTISLFGELNIITFSEWLNNVVSAYRLLVYPAFELVFSPLLVFLSLDIDSWEIDLIIVIFFFLNRFLADMLAYEFFSLFKGGESVNRKRKFVLNLKRRSVKRVFVYLYKVEKNISRYNIITLTLIRNIILISALIALIKAFDGIEITRPENIQSHHVVSFFMALYIIPLFILSKVVLVLSVNAIIYAVKYFLYIVGVIKSPIYEHPIVSQEVKMLKKQTVFCFQFTFGFLLIIGVNYKYLQ